MRHRRVTLGPSSGEGRPQTGFVTGADHEVRVAHKGGDCFEIAVRRHLLHVDQPLADGGNDSAPTPTELFVASLASCIAFYGRRFLARHDLRTESLTVSARFTMADHPARVGAVAISIEVPRGVPAERRPALLAAASHCTVHNTLEQPPSVTIELAP
jgi:putative redox protein